MDSSDRARPWSARIHPRVPEFSAEYRAAGGLLAAAYEHMARHRHAAAIASTLVAAQLRLGTDDTDFLTFKEHGALWFRPPKNSSAPCPDQPAFPPSRPTDSAIIYATEIWRPNSPLQGTRVVRVLVSPGALIKGMSRTCVGARQRRGLVYRPLLSRTPWD